MLQAAHNVSVPCFPAFARTSNTAEDKEGRQIRIAAADLYRQGRLAEAEHLTRAALEHFPDSEDVLVIRALICEVRHDWAAAASALGHLLQVQAEHAPAETCCHLVRVLRCDGQLTAAMQTALHGLRLHPAHPALASELAQLEALITSDQAKAA